MQRDLIWLLLAMIVETVHTERCTVAQLESADLPLSHTECCWLGLDSAFQPLCSCPVGYHISMSYECVFGPGESPPTPPPTIDTGVQPGEGEYHCSIDDLLGQHLDNYCCGNVKFEESSARFECMCPPGHIVNSSDLSCDECAPGYYGHAHVSGAHTGACHSCPAGRYSEHSAATTCTACEAGRYSQNDTGSVACTSCPIGTFNQDESMSSPEDCLLCTPGSFSDVAGASACQPCPSGYGSAAYGTTSCDICPPGTRYREEADGNGDCEPCSHGKYQNVPGQHSCVACEPGRWQNETGSTNCKAHTCGPGEGYPGLQYGSGNFEQYCIPCGAGRYSDDFSGDMCTACQVGKAQPNTSQTSCIDCAAGSHSEIEGSSTCELCFEGTYQPLTGEKKISSPCDRQLRLVVVPDGSLSGGGRGTWRRPAHCTQRWINTPH